jgi:hypothetical protein
VTVLQRALGGQRMPPSTRAELVLALGEAELADRRFVDAQRSARSAAAMFRSQHRSAWEPRARLLEYRARFEAGKVDPGLARRVCALAVVLENQFSDEACQAHLLAGRLYLARGRTNEARRHLLEASSPRQRGRVLTRVTARLAQALLAELDGNARDVARACSSGLDAVDQMRVELGSLELRATGAAHGAELAAIGLRQAVRSGRASGILNWTERWRATALTLPPAPGGHDPTLTRELAALRASFRTLEEARTIGTPTEALERAHARQERAVLDRQRQLAGARSSKGRRFSTSALQEGLREHVLVELVEVGEDLCAVVIDENRIRWQRIGPTASALNTVDFARVALRNLSIGPTSPLGRLADHLQAALLGTVPDAFEGRPVVLVPPSRFSGVPWADRPALTDATFTVSPSAELWLRGQAQPSPSAGRVVLVEGPGLRGAVAEIDRLSALYPDAVVVRGANATVDRVLDEIDGAWLVHVAAHGRFRQEAPTFSNLKLYDGPLMVHDMHRLTLCPHRFILSACETGLSLTPGNTDELLGFASALIGLGAAGVASGVTDVNDLGAVQLMEAIHDGLRSGQELPGSLAEARRRSRGGASEVPSVCFVSYGR